VTGERPVVTAAVNWLMGEEHLDPACRAEAGIRTYLDLPLIAGRAAT
jgi:hypothetical protein